MKKHINGSVATYCELKNGHMVTQTRPLRVLRNYLEWGKNPKHWSNIRAAELSAALAWALAHIPDDILIMQGVEERE